MGIHYKILGKKRDCKVHAIRFVGSDVNIETTLDGEEFTGCDEGLNLAIEDLCLRLMDLVQEEEARLQTQAISTRIEEEKQKAYLQGLEEGAAKQAILELRARDKFLEDLRKDVTNG